MYRLSSKWEKLKKNQQQNKSQQKNKTNFKKLNIIAEN